MSVQNLPQLPHTLAGIVSLGNQRGRLFGYPTANIHLQTNLPDGVYVATVSIKKTMFKALAFFGKNETFNENERKLEVHVLDFSDDLYGQILEVNMLHFLRGSIKFSLIEKLIEQMKADEKQARLFFDELK